MRSEVVSRQKDFKEKKNVKIKGNPGAPGKESGEKEKNI